jgi:uncharacterized membrane protein YoaK (UPF0700 family)
MIDLVEVSFGSTAAPARARLRKMIAVVLGFAFGAVAGGLGVVWFGYWCMACPILALLIMLFAHGRVATTTRDNS